MKFAGYAPIWSVFFLFATVLETNGLDFETASNFEKNTSGGSSNRSVEYADAVGRRCVLFLGDSASCVLGSSAYKYDLLMAFPTYTFVDHPLSGFHRMKVEAQVEMCESQDFRAFECITMKQAPVSGFLKCSSWDSISGNLGLQIKYFHNIHAFPRMVRTNSDGELREPWRPLAEDVVQIKEENDQPSLELPNATNASSSSEISYCDDRIPAEIPTNWTVFTLYSGQTARFECHILKYALTHPVEWLVGWENGTQQEIFKDYGEKTTNETRYTKNHAVGSANDVHIMVASSHVEFQAVDGMANISCNAPYLQSSVKADYTQLFVIQNGSKPGFTQHQIDYVERGVNLQLDCRERRGRPAPSYVWEYRRKTRPDQFRAFSKGYTKRVQDSESGDYYSLLIVENASDEDDGDYKCVAKNFLGTDTQVFYVRVRNQGFPLFFIIILGILAVWFVFASLMMMVVHLQGCLSKLEIAEFKGGKAGNTLGADYANDFVKHMPYDESFEVPRSRFEITQKDEEPFHSELNLKIHRGNMTLGDGSMVAKRPIAIKTSNAGKANLIALLDELKIMIYLGQHDFIVDFKGACTEKLNKGRAYILTEFYTMGSLQSFLRDHINNYRQNLNATSSTSTDPPNDGNPPGAEEIKDMMLWSVQIANAMDYLESKKVIHGHLTVQNVLMKTMRHVVITNFGLSRPLLVPDRFSQTKEEQLPWRHMSIEALKSSTYSSHSDVWSYGVTIWEILTLGAVPYPGMKWTPAFLGYLEDGLRLSKPRFATKAVYKTLMRCWDPEPEVRPRFKELESFFRRQLGVQ